MANKKPTIPTDKEKDIKLSKPSDVAAGPAGVAATLKHAYGQVGLLKCTKTLLNLNQPEGFDCPSCAWPDPKPEERSAFAEYCENGAKAIAEEATEARADISFFQKHSVDQLMDWSERDLGKAGRLTHPMILKPGSSHYESISWEAAFDIIGNRLQGLESPDKAVFYTSGRTSNEAAFMYQLFVRQFGTNNLPDCSNMCHESTGMALAETIGIGKGTVKLEDFYVSDLIIVIGQNPGTNHPRMLSALQKAKRRGAKIIGINPLPETGLKAFKNPQEVSGWIGKPTELSDEFLQVQINQDITLLKAIMKVLLQFEDENPGSVIDEDFIKKYTSGYEDLIKDLKEFDLRILADQCGVSLSEIEKAAALIRDNKRMIICWAMGITQHENGVENVREIINLLLMRGSIGIPGAGACPVRGHSNVQGDRTMGIWEVLKPEFAERLKNHFNFEPPTKTGYHTVSAIDAMSEGKVDVFVSMGGNLLLAGPDTDKAAAGMRQCDLTVMVSTKLNRNHLVTGKTALVLPCLGRTEKDIQAAGPQFVSCENSMGIVHSSKGVLRPASPMLRSEPAIIAEMAKATLGEKSTVDWDAMVNNYDNIRDAIEACIPGFENYNERVRREGGFYLPNGPRERDFTTQSGKALFTVNPIPKQPLAEGELLMTTVRSHDQFNTTIYDHNDRYRGIKNGRRIAMMHPEDIEAAGLKQGDFVDLFGTYQGEKRTAPNFMVVSYNVPRRCVATYFPEANALVPLRQHSKSYTPASKSVVITLEKARSV